MQQSSFNQTYRILPYRRLLQYGMIFSCCVSSIVLIPLAADGLIWQTVVTSFVSGLSIGLVATLTIWGLLHWTMPLAQRHGWQPIRAWSLASLVGGMIGTTAYAFIYGFFFVDASERRSFVTFWLLLGVGMAILTTVLFYAAERIQHELQQGRAALRHNAALAEEMRLAQMIQSSLLPEQPPLLAGVTIAGGCYSAREVGGDLLSYDVNNAGQLFISVGDVTGKSVSAAMLMGVTLGVLQANINAHHSPAIILNELDRWLRLKQQGQRFVALQIARLDPVAAVLTLGNAGQLAPLLLRRGRSAQYLNEPAGLPLGVGPLLHHQESATPLHQGDTLIFYTDGVIEAHNNTGELWGFERFTQCVESLPATTPPADYVAQIRQAIKQWSGTQEQSDDITLVVVRID